MSEKKDRVETFECCYPLCHKPAYAFPYWLPEGNPKLSLCKEHFKLAEFARWYEIQKKGDVP